MFIKVTPGAGSEPQRSFTGLGPSDRLKRPDELHELAIEVHEAGHAIVGTAVGLVVERIASATPSSVAAVHFTKASVGRASGQAHLAVGAAGILAELILVERPVEDAFDRSLQMFFEALGEEEINSIKAKGIASAMPDDDVYSLAYVLSHYSTRARGTAQFRLARARAIRLLNQHWNQVDALAHTLSESGPITGPIALNR